MSRVGKYPVALTDGVKAELAGQVLSIKGKKGTLSTTLPREVLATLEGDKLVFKPASSTIRARAMWGLARANAQNMVKGVQDGYSKTLEINGVGFRAALQGKNLKLSLGFSHEVEYPIPAGIEMKCPKPTVIEISGIDIQKVGQVAAEIRRMKKPEPYKGKGIKYSTETVRRKEGKKK